MIHFMPRFFSRLPFRSRAKVSVRVLFGVAAGFVLLFSVTGQAADTRELERLGYYTEDYYPYNYMDNGMVRGVSADTLRLVWKKLGLAEQPITLLPWVRAFGAVQKSPGTVLFSVARTPERDADFRWACPIDEVRFVLWAKKDANVVVNTLWDLQNYTIGTIRGDITDQLLQSMGVSLKVESAPSMEHNMKDFNNGRVDILAYEERSMGKYLQQRGLAPDAYEVVYLLKAIPVCFAFNLSVSESVVKRFEDALHEVRNTPEFHEVRTRYLD